MSVKIKKGAPVTVMSLDGHPIQGHVTEIDETGMHNLFFVAFPQGSSATMAEVVRSNQDEGVHWIRGHHADDSTEVHALLAAWALGRRF